MKINANSDLPPILYAEASVHSIGGESIFATTKSITSQTVEQFYSQDNMIHKSVEKLKANGFQVLHVGQTSISIAASPKIFENVFHTKIVMKELEVQGIPGKTSTTILDSTNSNIQGLIDTSNSEFADVLEGIAISEKAFLHSPASAALEETSVNTPGRLAPNPPQKDYYHLKPPEDLAKLLLAERAHQKGITGKGIKVVMVDTGFYRHPFFTKRQYHINPVILGPETTNPIHDERGHGTGEAANVFSLAPDIDFTMVKMNKFNTTGAFELAVAQNPDIITCSWGLATPPNQLTASQLALATAIANAVHKGITVVFASGNGGEPFPGMHPDVISVGGTFVDRNGSMEATEFVSGYKSTTKPYENRLVPDICGLSGLPPMADYIMLPVEPGDWYDEFASASGQKHPNGDETSPIDGWAAFSGTSAAAPQVAGVCALLKQANSRLSHFQIRDILKKTARDVTKGQSQQKNPAHQGPDIATGFGLVDASRAVDEAINML
ncbi:peptidase S8 [Bacillus cereus]|uniref:S8 family serine peptidase n=1 Tax=Bacillus cereus group TaxID=86661 RepID=UPI000BEE07E2|nr:MULTISPECIES: S8 family serine peptidase [Bacillus cereus group]WIK99005.1 S8 family serine peptidase [Bacillus bombysepticus]MDA2462662.1 S8 family serine peptidase [Bacillus cereus]PEA92798.1 peptidase S8 [Bacillus cereus]PEF50182.1 peptidase S8 [Bacillus thuringiensis]PFO87478.1 peptidase S8 [Bacillus cereus]